MKKVIIFAIIITAIFSSCKKEDDVFTISILTPEVEVSNDYIKVIPHWGEEDKCTYTVVYFLNENEIERRKIAPFDLTYNISGQITPGETYVLKIKYYGKYSGNYDNYFEHEQNIDLNFK